MSIKQKIRRAIILISFLLFPVTINYFSPYIIIDGASQGIITGSFITFTLLFIVSLFFGRAFCSWVCPGGGIQEWCFVVNENKAKRRKLNWIKYFIWVPWISIIIILVVLSGGFHTINPLYLTETGISVSEPAAYILYFTIIGLFVILSFAAGKRAFCHYLCWMAPFMIIGTKIKNYFKWPSLHLEATKEKCKKCKKCEKNCPMSLEVTEMVQTTSMENPECILCGVCADNCPQGAIKYSWKQRK